MRTNSGRPRAALPRPALGVDGFTMMEVLVAMVILGFVLLGTQAAITDRLVVDMGKLDRRAIATQLAADRVEMIKMDRLYASLETKWNATEVSFPDYPGFKRVTQIVQVTTVTARGKIDYKRVTVTVTNPNMPRPVTRTAIVAAP
jgi:prepilin-type N-terminal cleavage/methylation domain-containing protein